MNDLLPAPRMHSGYMLLEVMISILIFAIGIIGTITMQATSIRHNSESNYRIEACFLVDALIGRMWSDDRAPAALAANYATGGPAYNAWLVDVQTRLPGVADYPPTVTVTTVAGLSPPATSKSRITTTVQWKTPGESVVHNHVAITEIK
jgi:type IV pilus assembly protein PilV